MTIQMKPRQQCFDMVLFIVILQNEIWVCPEF